MEQSSKFNFIFLLIRFLLLDRHNTSMNNSNVFNRSSANNTSLLIGGHRDSGPQGDVSMTQMSYGIPTIKLLNPELYKEMEKRGRQMRDPIYQSLKNIKERHTYLENR